MNDDYITMHDPFVYAWAEKQFGLGSDDKCSSYNHKKNNSKQIQKILARMEKDYEDE